MANWRYELTFHRTSDITICVMSKLIKSSRGLFGLGISVVSLWVVVVSYASHVIRTGPTSQH